MLPDVTVLPNGIAAPVIFSQQPTTSTHVVRSFGEPASPKQIAVLQKLGIRAVDQRVIPLVNDIAAQIDQICRPTIEGRIQRIARRCPVLAIKECPKSRVT